MDSQKTRDAAKSAAQWLTHYLNSYNDEERARLIAEEVRNEHRTLQQSVFRFMVELMSQWSEDYQKGNYDKRNEHTVRTAHEIMKTIDKKDIPTI